MSENLYRKVTAEEIEYEKQESRFRFMLDMNSLIGEAEDRGLARGRSEGEQLGLERGKREIAKNLKLIGIAVDKITEATGLSITEIEAL